MKKFLFFLFFIILFPLVTEASSIGQKLAGQILLDVERNGEAWYVYPEDNKRYYLGRPADAFKIMRELGLGITEENITKIEIGGNIATSSSATSTVHNKNLAYKLSGKIVLEVEKNGEAWYIYPEDNKRYYLGRPDDAFRIMRELSLGITREDLARVHKPGLEESLNKYSKYEHKIIDTVNGDYSVDVVEIDLDNPSLKIITDTADNFNCEKNCSARTLADFVLENDGFAGINGTYFDTSVNKKNYYFFPVFNSKTKKLINNDELKYWTTGPIMAWDEDNNFYYFKDSREFKSVEYFEETYNTKLQAALGNKPRLIEDKMNLLIDWDIDDKQRYTKSLRNALAYKYGKDKNNKGKLYLVIARNTTVPDLANIMKAMEVDYALNLDGGYSSALWYNDEYMVSPGRDIPNAIIFSEK